MGLSRPAIRFLAREFKRRPFQGPVLTLGRLGVFATLDEAREMLLSEDVGPAALPPEQDVRTNIPGWLGTWNERYTNDVALFGLFGLRGSKALDYSDYEKPDFLIDLNKPVPEELHGRFPTIIDGGTIEHVFDVKQALTNVGLLLKPGGRIIHFLPVNNCVNHGFYQFSPTLFFDYYGANAFADLHGVLIDESRYRDSWDIYELPGRGYAGPSSLVSTTALAIAFVAEKTDKSTAGSVPMQGRYEYDYVAQPDTQTFRASESSLKAMLRRRLPQWIETFLRRYVLAYDPANRLPRRLKILLLRFVPGFDKRKESWNLQLKPWGLKFLGTLD